MSPMHERVLSHFGFSRLPFSKQLSVKDLFASASHKEALARLAFGLTTEDLLLLTGAVGCGKSLALMSFVDQLDANCYHPVYVRATGLSEGQLFKTILEGLRIEAPFFSSHARRLFFSSIPQLPRKPVVLLDDAQDLPQPTLRALKSMANFNFDSHSPITFVLAGQPELRTLLGYAQFLSLRQRIRISCHMHPLSLQESCHYIQHHTSIAGCPTSIFSDAAQAAVHRHTNGVPRAINAICFRSVLHAVANDIKVIDDSDLDLDEIAD